MGGWRRSSSTSSSFSDPELDRSSSTLSVSAHLLDHPFPRPDNLHQHDLRLAAYDIFFTACRSTPGFGASRAAPSYYPHNNNDSSSSNNSRLKKALGLRSRRGSTPMRSVSFGSATGKTKQRPMTSAEIMRVQMGVSEQSDARIRKTLVRTLAGQANRKPETIIVPLELLRQLKPSEFGDSNEYYLWQRRQLKILEAGLLLHPFIPLDRLNAAGLRLSDVIRATESRPIDGTKNSEAMRTLANSVLTLAWRNNTGAPLEVCHWADGFPLNVHLYTSLLHAIFDVKEETMVIDEMDDLLELMGKTWTILGINRPIHNVLLTCVIFEQYVMTGQVEPDLISATLAMLVEVANDAKTIDRDPGYSKIVSATMASIQGWAEKKLLDYHRGFPRNSTCTMENIICLALSTAKIIVENASNPGRMVVKRAGDSSNFSPQTNIEQYIKSSLKNSFTKISGSGTSRRESMVIEVDDDPDEKLLQLAKATEELALTERELYSPILKRWHPFPAAVAMVTLHSCFRVMLKQYIANISCLTNGLVRTLQAVGKLEKTLVQMAVEETVDSEDGGKGVIKEMVPYEVESIILKLMRSWIDDKLRFGRDCVSRAKDTENWSTKSRSEPYAESAVDLMKMAKMAVDEFFEIQIGAKDELLQVLADGLDSLVQDYTSFVAACGKKQSYIPSLPPLTRCNQDSSMFQFWKCKAGIDPTVCRSVMDPNRCKDGLRTNISFVHKAGAGGDASSNQRTTVSRGTQRLYIRLNTLHYLLKFLHEIDKSISAFTQPTPSPNAPTPRPRAVAPTHFETARSAVHAATVHVAELASYRLVFVDCSSYFYESLYSGNVAEARIKPVLGVLKQSLSLLVSMLTDRAQPLAVREVMKASFEAFMLVLLAGGSERAFVRTDYTMITEDFMALKRLFCTSGEGLVAEEVVEREAEVVEGVLYLMSLTTEKLVEEFSIRACEASGLGRSMERVPMPPTNTIRWHRSDPSTMLRVLCHRDDDVANRFLKRAFELPKRR